MGETQPTNITGPHLAAVRNSVPLEKHEFDQKVVKKRRVG
jgi:hypothetical protein